jgi:thiol-disulfide isomerase/thioredoxin
MQSLRFSAVLCALAVAAAAAPAQLASRSTKPVAGCQVPSALDTALRSQLDPNRFHGIPFDTQTAQRYDILTSFIDKYPHEVEPQKELVELALDRDRSYGPRVQEFFRQRELKNPADPLALYAAGYSLSTTDAPAAFSKLNQATELDPNFAWPYLALAGMYSEGNVADPKALDKNIIRFATLCPNVTSHDVQISLSQSTNKAAKKEIAAQLRQYLHQQTDPSRLTYYDTQLEMTIFDYEALWALEFQTAPVTDYDALRPRVKEDMRRLEALQPNPSADFLLFLNRGSTLAGDPPSVTSGREDQILRQFPLSSQALNITWGRWSEHHPQPSDPYDLAAWQKFMREQNAALLGWTHQFTDDYAASTFYWTNTISDNEVLSDSEAVRVFHCDMRYANEILPPNDRVWHIINASQDLLRRKVQPAVAVQALNEAQTILDAQNIEDARLTTLTPEEKKKQELRETSKRKGIVSNMLEAAIQLKQPELVASMRSEIETAPPTDVTFHTWYWANRARLARVDARNADALAYYQLALQSRTDKPRAFRGKTTDDLDDEIRAYWKQSGGSDVAFAVWSKPPAHIPELAGTHWEKPSKPLPDFELTDLSGKSWRLQQLNGKVLLINVWATWCEFCVAEMPQYQALYDKLKNRTDVQLLSFNIDDDPGLVAPFMKDHGYKFPVLLANSYASETFNQGIPQNWIVSSNGAWEWAQRGGGDVNQWQDEVLKRMGISTAQP